MTGTMTSKRVVVSTQSEAFRTFVAAAPAGAEIAAEAVVVSCPDSYSSRFYVAVRFGIFTWIGIGLNPDAMAAEMKALLEETSAAVAMAALVGKK